MPQSKSPRGRHGRPLTSRPLPMMDVATSRHADGMRVVSARIPYVQSVSVGVWIRTGSRGEPQCLNGVSHFLEHLLFKGTHKRTARQITYAVEGRGGYLNAFTSEEHTCFYARVAREELKKTLDVISDMMLSSRISATDVKRERAVIMEEITMYRDQPQQLVQDMLMGALWPRHPLGRPIVGTPESVAGLRRADVARYLRDHYTANRATVAFAGSVSHEECRELSERYFGGLPKRGRARSWPRGDRWALQHPVVLQARDTEQAQLAMGFRLFGGADKRRHALKLLSAVMGENMSSRLFQSVRERAGLAYNIYSSVNLFRECGFFGIAAGMEAGRILQVLKVICRELKRIRERPVSGAELRRARDYMIGQLRLGLEGPTPQMMWVGEDLVSRGSFLSPETTIEALRSVTTGDVQAIAREVFDPQTLSIAAISPQLTSADEPRILEIAAQIT